MIAVFPGQGSQHVGMAKDLFEQSFRIREMFEEASDAIQINLKKLCFDSSESDLTLTENTQPCLLLASVAAFRFAQTECEVKPQVFAGHSLGEYSALVAMNALPLDLAIRWVRARGLAMQSATPVGTGSMAAVLSLEDSEVTELCRVVSTEVGEVLEPANFNAPGQVVISGSVLAIQRAGQMVKDNKKGRLIPLQVSAPFHSSLMKPARDKMSHEFSQGNFVVSSLSSPYVPNVTGRMIQEASLVYEFLVEQVDHPVLWRQSMTSLLQAGHQKLVEFGPGKVLGGLMKRISSAVELPCDIFSVNTLESVSVLEQSL